MTVLTAEFIQNRDARNMHIGNVCHQWAHLELSIAVVIWQLLGVDEETGRLLTGGLDIQPRVNKAIALAEHLNAPPQLKKALRQTRTALQDGLDERRNQAVHGARFTDHSSPLDSQLFVMHRGKNAGKPIPVSNADLEKLGRDIFAAHKPLMEAMRSCGVLQAPTAKPARIIAPKAARKAAPSSPRSKS